MKHRRPVLDPFADREATKYENPIPSREFILAHLDKKGEPVTYTDLLTDLHLKTEAEAEALQRRLRAMERDGQLIVNRRGAYALVNKMDLIPGRVQGHKDGFGFVIPDDGSDDLYLNNRQIRLVLDGDRVVVRVAGEDRRGRREAVIVEVIERNTHHIVGRFFKEGGIMFVAPDNRRINQDILIAPDAADAAEHGQYVMVEITAQPSPRCPPQGKVIEVLGDHLAPGMEIDVAIRSHGIPHDWPEDVLAQIDNITPEVLEKDKQNRVDVRHVPLVTIDGEDARDFDDAVYCEPVNGGWRLMVAIADVSHYVELNTALDKEAYQRGTSVYFPGFVVPMLPEVLSNGLCSLNPEVDRLCMICDMSISTKGAIEHYRFYEGVMRSRARLTYNQVGAMLETPSNEPADILRKKYADVVPHLENLHALYKVLSAARALRGAIDFDTTETQIVFGKERKIEKIVPLKRNDAHKLIEECMLSANVAAARFLEAHELVGLYRVHDRPRSEKITNLRDFLGEFGLNLGGEDEPTTLDYQKLLKDAQSRPEIHLIQMVMLRSMMQAVYSPTNKGHFGLNYDEYAHFTSPIRRYPDLLVHRALRSIIRSKTETDAVQRAQGAKLLTPAEIYPYNPATMAMMGEHCSMAERRADEATREATSWLKCEYIQDRIGETFDGLITAVTGFGIFVELKDIYVEGLVHVTSLANDYYHYDAAKHRLVGEQTSTMYRLGDRLRVTVMRVDLETRKIDFELADVVVGRKAQKQANKKTVKEKGPAKPGRIIKQGKPTALVKKPSKEAETPKESKDGKFKKFAKKMVKKITGNSGTKSKDGKESSGSKASHAGPSDAPSFNIRKRKPKK